MRPPVFAFLAFTGGALEGAVIRDIRIANELHRRGYKVVVYWGFDSNADLVDPAIRQRVLSRGTRYLTRRPNRLTQELGHALQLLPAERRQRALQRRIGGTERVLTNFVDVFCNGPGGDPALERKLAAFLKEDGVTHLMLPMALLGSLALGAQRVGASEFDYAVALQGEELLYPYAMRAGRLDDFRRRAREAVAGSRWPAAASSHTHLRQMARDMGIDPARLAVVYGPVDLPDPADKPPFDGVARMFPALSPEVPIVTFVGRQDPEKGVDLLLFAAKILQERGVKMQLVVCGGSSFGDRYRQVLMRLAELMHVPLHHRGQVSFAERDLLFAHSRCVVYPSVWFEPFGMVPPEAMALGTPAIVPAAGGVSETIVRDGVAAGLAFSPWDSGDLARQIERLVTDDGLHADLSSHGRFVAEQFSTARVTDRLLESLGVKAS